MFRVIALTIVVGVAVAVGPPNLVAAQSTCSLPVAAYLTDSTGAPLDGMIELEVRFYVDGGADALPVECRSTSASLDGGWLRFLVDVCSPPEPDDCGVVTLSSVFESSDATLSDSREGATVQLSMKSSTGDGSVVHQTAISTPGIIRERNSPWRTSHRCDWYILSPLPTA